MRHDLGNRPLGTGGPAVEAERQRAAKAALPRHERAEEYDEPPEIVCVDGIQRDIATARDRLAQRNRDAILAQPAEATR